VVSGTARGQALLGPMWAGLTPDSKRDPTGDTGEPARRRQKTPHLSARRKRALPASPGGPPSTGQKKLRVLNPILRLYRVQSTGKSFLMTEVPTRAGGGGGGGGAGVYSYSEDTIEGPRAPAVKLTARHSSLTRVRAAPLSPW